jgi:hypothetical protein
MRRVLIFSTTFAFLVFLVVSSVSFSQSGEGSVDLDARVPGCGDGVIDVGEDCDLTNLNGKSCSTQGFSSGTLSCTASCTLNTSACTVLSAGGSGGGGGSTHSNKAQVVLSGRAYPKSIVTVLKDAQIVATTVADDDARFQINVSGLSSGSYIFSLYSEDNKGLRSSLRTFPVYLTRGILAKIESIFIAPTLATDKSEVRRGDPIILFGQTTPISDVTVEINSNEQIFVNTKADKMGVYLHMFNTAPLEYGQHHAQSRASVAAAISAQSATAAFVVGNKNVLSPTGASCPQKADLNGDCRVNLVDFSIAAYWYNRPLNEAFTVREGEKLSGDKKVNITDFSIMAFYWTG